MQDCALLDHSSSLTDQETQRFRRRCSTHSLGSNGDLAQGSGLARGVESKTHVNIMKFSTISVNFPNGNTIPKGFFTSQAKGSAKRLTKNIGTPRRHEIIRNKSAPC